MLINRITLNGVLGFLIKVDQFSNQLNFWMCISVLLSLLLFLLQKLRECRTKYQNGQKIYPLDGIARSTDVIISILSIKNRLIMPYPSINALRERLLVF